jgi:hypothetical protein
MQKIWSVVDLLRRNPHWWSPIISSTYGLSLERRIFGKILYEVLDFCKESKYYVHLHFQVLEKCVNIVDQYINHILVYAQVVSGRRVSILGGHSIGHSEQKCIYTSVLFQTVSEIELFPCTVHWADEQHAMSSHELQSAWMLTVEFSKMYCRVFAR